MQQGMLTGTFAFSATNPKQVAMIVVFVGCSETWGAARDPCVHLFEGRKLEIGDANTR